MTPAKRAKGFRQIVSIRSAQEAAAEIRVQQLLAVKDEQKRQELDLEARQEAERQLWLSATAATPMNLPLAEAWAQASNRSNIQLMQLRQRLDEGEVEIRTAQTEWGQAQAKSEVAKDLLRSAIQKQSRRVEEETLREALDGFAFRGAW